MLTPTSGMHALASDDYSARLVIPDECAGCTAWSVVGWQCAAIIKFVGSWTVSLPVSLQNAAARLITWMGHREHISPVLQELHWLPVWCHVDFKLATLMFKSLHGCAPSYRSDACKSAPETSRCLRSSGAITCIIPWSRTHLGDRSFDVTGPQLWNKLPASLQSSHSLPIQKTVEVVLICQVLGCSA